MTSGTPGLAIPAFSAAMSSIRLAEELLVVDPELGDAADGRRGDDVGRVEPSAEADLDDAGVGRDARESEEGGGGGRLEEADLHPAGGVERLLEQGGEQASSISVPGEPDALVEADEVGAGVDVDALSPAASIAARRKAQVEPLPLVPATWRTGGSRRSGLPRRASRAVMRSSPSMSAPGDSVASRSSWRWTAGSVGDGAVHLSSLAEWGGGPPKGGGGVLASLGNCPSTTLRWSPSPC